MSCSGCEKRAKELRDKIEARKLELLKIPFEELTYVQKTTLYRSIIKNENGKQVIKWILR